jgi:glycogen(starch) synthase
MFSLTDRPKSRRKSRNASECDDSIRARRCFGFPEAPPIRKPMRSGADRPLRLCFVSSDYPVRANGRDVVGGGMGAHAHTLANAVAALGHEVTVLTESDRSEEQHTEGSIRIQALARGSHRQWKLGPYLPVPWIRRSLVVWKAISKLNRSSRFDLVRFPDGYGEGLRYSFSPPVPFSVHLHGPASILQRWDGRRIPPVRARMEAWMERRPAIHAPLLVAGTRWFADFMTREWGLDPACITIIRNPLDVSKFNMPPADFPNDSRTILFAGHLQWFKGVSVLASAIPVVLARRPDAKFKFVGNDTKSAPGGGSLRTYIEHDLSKAGALESVQFLDPVSHDKLVNEYHRCAALVLPSFQETYGNVVIEAMACGRPSIVTRTVGAAELVAPGTTGLVVEPDDPPALANAICQLLDMSPAARREMGMRGRGTVEKSCAADKIAAQTIASYRELLSRQPLGARQSMQP